MMEKKCNVAILIRNNNLTETFIQNHIQYIPQNIFVFRGTPVPHKLDGEKTISSIEYYIYKIKSIFQKKKFDTFLKEKILYKSLQKKKIDVVLAEFLNTGAEALQVCKTLGIPMIVTVYGYDISSHTIVEKYKEKYKELLLYCRNVIIVSEHMREKLITLGCAKEKIIYSPTGPHPDFFNIQADYSSNNFVALGRFVEKKAPHLSILAINKVIKQYPLAQLTMGGDGPLLPFCLDLIDGLGLHQNVHLIGYINREKQKELFRNSLSFIQHSRTAKDGDQEGTPVAILEASAAGLPIVSTLHAGIPDVVHQNKTGFLVSEGDVNSMAEKMVELLHNRNLAKEMGEKGKNLMREVSLEKHIQVINKIIVDIYETR